MALLYCDSFDHYSLPSQKGWSSNDFDISGAYARSGPSGLGQAFGGLESETSRSITAASTIIVGTAFRFPALTDSIFALRNGGTTHVYIQLNGSGNIDLYHGGGALIAAGTTTLSANTWYYIELKVTISDSGYYELRLNGVSTEYSGTADLKNGSSTTVNQFAFTHNADTDRSSFDDLYICDDTGLYANDFLGDVRIEAIFPNGNGAHSDWTGSDGNSVDNYLLVDETTPDSDTTYVEASVVGYEDTYAFTNVTPTSGTVYAVQMLPYAKKTDAGSRSISPVARVSGTEQAGTAQFLSSSYAYLYDIRHTNPLGAQWSISDINSAEFGYTVNS